MNLKAQAIINTMKRNIVILAFILLIITGEPGPLSAAPHRLGDTLTLKEHLGYAWNTDYVHRRFVMTNPGSFFPDRVVLYDGQRLALPTKMKVGRSTLMVASFAMEPQCRCV